jgi:hypothetical protein
MSLVRAVLSDWSVWATKRILHLNEPVLGYGRLLAEMP